MNGLCLRVLLVEDERAVPMDTRPAGFVHKPVDYAALQEVLQALPGPACPEQR